jgi:hypothetical protein
MPLFFSAEMSSSHCDALLPVEEDEFDEDFFHITFFEENELRRWCQAA